MQHKFALLFLAAAAAPAWSSTILFDDLSNPQFSAVSMSPTQYDAVQLHTDGNTYTVTQATLVLQASDQIILTELPQGAHSSNQEIIGSGTLSIYDATAPGAQPANVIGTFTGPSILTTTFGDNIFTTSGIVLQPDTEYWLVFQVTVGTVSWGVDVNGSPGTGPLFDGSVSPGSVANGFNGFATLPTQTQLLGTVSTTSSSTPEPTTLLLTLAGLGVIVSRRFRK